MDDIVVVANRSEAARTRVVYTARASRSLDWLPLVVLPAGAIALADRLPAWGFMWALAFAIYSGFKWLTWRRSCEIAHPALWRSAAYLLAWPGMDAEAFLSEEKRVVPPQRSAWLGAILQTAFGVTILWLLARTIPAGRPLFRGWVGMLGAILILHFGTFKIAALVWRRYGVDATPMMRAPLLSASLSEFWGQRWNSGFHKLAHDLIFAPLYRRVGVRMAGFAVFVASGLVHDLVISFPARGGYGLPTLYFALQGAGVALERSRLGRRLGLREGARGWILMAIVTAGPLIWLFHPPFVLHVIIPLMEAIHAL